MRIFLTGATGFIGSHVIPHLLEGGHRVVGLTRSEVGAEQLREAGVEPYEGTLEDPQTLAKGAEAADAVIHCAFDHDFSNFAANCAKDERNVRAIGEVLRGSDRPFVITSGTALGAKGDGSLATEQTFDANNFNHRIASERAAMELAETGVRTIVMRLPQVHDTRKQGLVTPLIGVSRAQGQVTYVGEGHNRWAAAHVSDVALLYKLAVEQGRAGERFHAVDEEGVSARDIAGTIAKGLGLPALSLTPEQAMEQLGMPFGFFAALDMPASSAWTRERLGWSPRGPGLLQDLRNMDYAAA